MAAASFDCGSFARAAGVARPTLEVRGEAVTVTLPFAQLERLTRE